MQENEKKAADILAMRYAMRYYSQQFFELCGRRTMIIETVVKSL
jgi:hypothetical protein